VKLYQSLADNPEFVNNSPYDKGWMMKIKITHPIEIDELISVEEYKELVKSEEQ
jgi:glycine cleavage system H protein